MNLKKYDPLTKRKSDQSHGELPRLTVIPLDDDTEYGQITSAPVIRLIEYLKMNPDYGVILYERDGSVGLRFESGISSEELKMEQGKIFINMFNLLKDAAADLKTLISQGIKIPLLIREI